MWRRRRPLGPLALLLALAVSGAGAPACARDEPVLRVLAAASLTEVVSELAERFEGRVEPDFGASSALARRIRDGAPADVYLSASPAWMDFLAEAGALDGPSVVVARNRLVCVAGEDGPLAARGVRGVADLLDALGPQDRIAIADEGVPAGAYARVALRHAGLLRAARGRLVGRRDVRAVLHAVESGELPAGFVYATDAAVARVTVLFALDPASHPPIEYRAAVVRGARHPDAARRFLAFLQGEVARPVLARAGFALPAP